MRTSFTCVGAIALAMALTLTACGGSDSPGSPSPAPSPSPSPTPSPSPGGGGNPTTATITITSTGVSPRSVTIAPGGRVTFVNNDTRTHEMDSNPHPEHTDCPAINAVGFLTPGQSKTTDNLTATRTCGFHDHQQPDVTNLQGSIAVQ